jgi:lipopolysaccharide export system permease protein
MRILDRYILKSVLTIFLACIFSFIFMYVVIDILSNLEDILKQQASLQLMIQYYILNLPMIFIRVTPFACLLATLYTLGKFNHNNEIIAMRAAGLSVPQITKTVIILGVLISLLVFWVNDRFLPRSLVGIQRVREKIAQGRKKHDEKKQEVINNLTIYGLRNRLFFVNKFTPETNTLDGITILEQDEKQNIVKKIVANKGVYKDGSWRFYQSITYNFDKNGQIKGEPEFFEEEIMAIAETPQDFLSQRQRPELMNIVQLDDYIWRLSKSGATTVLRNLKIDLYQRFFSPFTSLMIILLAIPFSLKLRKRATGLSSIGLSIMVGFLYYIVDAISIALGKGGMLIPILSASLSHIIALSYSLYLISRLR